MIKLISSIATILAVFLVIFFFGFSESTEEKLSRAHRYFANGNVEKANEALESVREEISPAEYLLYQSYLSRNEGDIEESNTYLEKIIGASSEGAPHSTVVEAYLNSILNAYLVNDKAKFSEAVEQHRYRLREYRGWLLLFQALEAFYHEKYSKAKDYANRAEGRRYLSDWMKTSFDHVFPEDWLNFFLAYCDLELGNLLETRQYLELASRNATPNELLQIDFLRGVSYLIEAKTKSADVAIPYYRLAFNYFDRIPNFEDHFPQKREMILGQVREKVRDLLDLRIYEHLLFYLGLLEQWNDHQAVHDFATAMVEAINEETSFEEWKHVETLAIALNEVLVDEQMRETIRLRFEKLLEQAIHEGDLKSAMILWKVATMYSIESDEQVQWVSDLLFQEFLVVIDRDDFRLKQSEPFISFWKQVSKNHSYRKKTAMKFAEVAERMWNKGEREKAVALLKGVKNDSPFGIQDTIEERFRKIYSLALKNDNLIDLNDILDAVEELDLANIDIRNEKEIALQQKQALQLFQEGEYRLAQEKALWILRLESENVQAKKILGMLAYQQGEYSQSLEFLNEIETTDPGVNEAKGITLILKGKEEEGKQFLKKVETVRPISDETYLRLGFGFLAQEKPMEATKWFDKVSKQSEEVAVGRCFASFLLNSWNEVIECYDKLPPRYQALDGFQGIVIESYIALGEVAKAEKALDQLMRKFPSPNNRKFSTHFYKFKNEKLDHWSRNIVAAMFEKNVRQNLPEALRYLNQMDSYSPYGEVEKADILVELGRFHEAKNVLMTVLEQIQGTKEETAIELRLLPLLASTLRKLGFYIEALSYFEEYYLMNPDEVLTRGEYAKVLMNVNRYDLAIKQFKRLQGSIGLSTDETLAYMKCLIKTDQFEKANQMAREWTGKEELATVDQLRLAQLMVISRNKAMIERILQGVGKKTNRTIEENIELIRLWMSLGNYQSAETLSNSIRREMEQTIDGLLTLMNLEMRLGRYDEAYQFAQMAAAINPGNLEVMKFLEKFEKGASTLAQSVKLLKQKMEQDKEVIRTLQVEYVGNLIDLAIELRAAGEITDLKESLDLQQARSILEKLIDKEKTRIPEMYFLLGKTYYLLDRLKEAEELLQKAVQLNPSYVSAYQYLALVREEQGKTNQAINAVRKALQFAPNDAKAWEQLAALLRAIDRRTEALDALQRAVRFAPNQPTAYVLLAEIYLDVNTPEKAIEMLERAIELTPKNVTAVKLMLVALYDTNYTFDVSDRDALERRQLKFLDKLQALDPGEAEMMRKKLGVEEK